MMRAILLILSASFSLYTLAVYTYCDPTPKPYPPAVSRGWQVWQEKNCQSCHQLYGLGGYAGPDLTNVASQKGPDYMRGLIRYGTGRMPGFHLREQEVDDVIAFLSWVDQAGWSKVPDSAVHWTGGYKTLRR